VPSLDILVSNAGISPGEPKPVTGEDPDTFRRIYETNVFGAVAVTNAFLPALKRSAHPRIVNISSGSASLAASAGPGRGHHRHEQAFGRARRVPLVQDGAERAHRPVRQRPGRRRVQGERACPA
jgi:NAD(P)-dependent dehydrogenase (short-subunit alcohol dehydrogenase family)